MKVLFQSVLAIVSLAAAALAAEPATGKAPPPDASQLLALTVRFERVGRSELLGSEFDWVHRAGEGVVTLGISASRIDDSRWTYVKAGAARKLGEKTLASAALDLGRGERPGASYSYRKIRARITHAPVPRRLQLYAEAQSYAVDRFHGTLVDVGASYRFEPAVTVGLGYSELIAGNSEGRIVFARIDVDRRLGYFAGMAHGTQAPSPAQVALDLRPDARYREIYAGVSVPVGDQRLMLLLDLVEHGDVRRRALVASWRVRLPAASRGVGG